MMYSSYSALQRRQLTKQVYTDTQSSYLLVYAPGRHLALENSLANQLHRKFRLVTALEGELTDSVAGVLLVSEDVECTSTALPPLCRPGPTLRCATPSSALTGPPPFT